MDEPSPTVTQWQTRQFHDGRSAKSGREHGYPGTQTDYRKGTGNRIALARNSQGLRGQTGTR